MSEEEQKKKTENKRDMSLYIYTPTLSLSHTLHIIMYNSLSLSYSSYDVMITVRDVNEKRRKKNGTANVRNRFEMSQEKQNKKKENKRETCLYTLQLSLSLL